MENPGEKRKEEKEGEKERLDIQHTSLDTPPKRIENTIFSDCAICLQEHVGY